MLDRSYAYQHPPNSALKIALLDTALFTFLIVSCIALAPVIGTRMAIGEYYKIPPRTSRRKHALRDVEDGKRRKRRLFGTKRRVRVEGQEDSLWFRLPYEVRQMVYGYFFDEGGTVDVGFDATYRLTGRTRGNDQSVRLGVLGLLRSCRRIYIEAVLLLYSLPTYKFMNPIAFLMFSATITPHAFHNLRSIFLDFGHIPGLSTQAHHEWPEPPACVRGICANYLVPADESSLLQRPKGYRNFRLSNVKNYFNPLVFRSGGRSVMKRRKTTPSMWRWTCDVLSEMQGLRTLEIKIRKCFKVWDEEPKLNWIFGTARIAAESHVSLQSFIVRIYGYDAWGCELPGELERWRKAPDGGKWTEVHGSLWGNDDYGVENEEEGLR